MTGVVDEGSSLKAVDADQSSVDLDQEQIFNQFCDSNNFQEILQLFKSLCTQVGVDPNQYEGFYSSLKSSLKSWRATSLFQLLDARASLSEYEGQKACAGKRVLIVGAGPVGLRAAIEATLLGAKVDLVEKRPNFMRNNSLHLWPFLITDLRNLGVKKFYGKFASGSIDHICIRILQAILLKISLLLGVKVHPGVTFNGLLEPKDTNSGWRMSTTPTTTPISSYDFDVLLAADGKQNSLPGFRSKEFRAKLALAITVNYVNHNTKQENSVPEIGGVAYVYRQDFFNNLAKVHGIELENIVYYKDETHYFVMTAKKQSLLRKGVLKKDNSDPKQLLSKDNIDRSNLEKYALEATSFATDDGLGEVEFEKNHRGENDVALFDFTSLFASENAARIIERKGKRLLLCLAGDSLIEPFWPLGTGCARGFLGAFDDAWMMKRFCTEAVSPIELLEEREAILYLLPQTTPRRLHSNHNGYTINPKSRYVNLSELVPPGDVTHLYDSDNQNAVSAIKSRSVPPSTQHKSQPAIEQRTVALAEEKKPKRSKSTEEIFSEAQPAEGSTVSPTPLRDGGAKSSKQTDTITSEPPTTSTKEVKHFWQKRQGPKNDPKPSSVSGEKIKKKTASEIKKGSHSVTKTDPSKPSPSTVQKHPQVKVSDKSTKTSNTKTEDSSKHPASSVISSKPPLPTEASPGKPKPKTGALTKPEVANKSTSSPKWSRFSLALRQRSRSESPERKPIPKKEKKILKEPKAIQHHPQHVSRSLQSLDRETEGPSGEGARTSVSNIIKKYDDRAESLAQSQTGAANKETQTKEHLALSDKSSKTKGAKKETSVNNKDKKAKSKEDKKAQKASKDTSTHNSRGGFFSFFKGRKSYNVSTSKDTDKSKSTKDNKLTEDELQVKEEAEDRLTVQGRIGKLKEIGLMTDGVDESDAVLLSVSKLDEPEVEEEMDVDEASPVTEEPTQPEPLTSDVSDFDSDVVKSKLKGTPRNEEEEKDETKVDDNMERVKKLKEVFLAKTAVSPHSRHLSYTKKRSKEIDLSELLSRRSSENASESSHPLWLARVIQGQNRCLERLRKENDIIVAKTALEILNTIISNVQSHPDCDMYRRVRVSSERFYNKVWQFNNASQFLARSGWVEIDDFIVLPIDSNVDNPKRVLDKHLNIVNHMLWSMQLELPDSPGVVKRLTSERRLRMRSTSLMKRESYSSRVVDESLRRVEEEKLSIITARLKDTSSKKTAVNSEGRGTRTESSERSGDVEPGVPTTFVEVGDNGRDEIDHIALVSPGEEKEESQTMRAASAARNVWLQRAERQENRVKIEREYKLILETELYDLPSGKVDVYHSETNSLSSRVITRPLPQGSRGQVSPLVQQSHSGMLSPTLAGVPEHDELSTDEDKPGNDSRPILSATATPEKNSSCKTIKQSFEVTDEHLRRLAQSPKQSSVNQTPKMTPSTNEEDRESPKEMNTSEELVDIDGTNEVTAVLSKTVDDEAQLAPGGGGSSLSQLEEEQLERVISSPSSSSGRSSSDQLRLLMMSTSPYPGSVSPLQTVHGESKSPEDVEESTSDSEVRPKPTTDAQHSTVHATQSERLEYGRLSIEAAAQTRQKWMESEASMATGNDQEHTQTQPMANKDSTLIDKGPVLEVPQDQESTSL